MSGYMTTQDIARLLGVKASTVRGYKARGLLPRPHVVVGKTAAWKRSQIDAWIAARPGQGRRRT